MNRFLKAATRAFSVFALPFVAQPCGGDYAVKTGESLWDIADRPYKDVEK